MDRLKAHKIHITPRRGSSWPLKVSTAKGDFLLKLSGAGQGFAALVAEVIVAEIATFLGFNVPLRVLIELTPETIVEDADPEVTELVARSMGMNLGFAYLPRARDITTEDFASISADDKALIYWLDWFTMNPDRTLKNPNMMLWERKLWLIDHGAALTFQHNWFRVRETSPGEVKAWLGWHVFAGFEEGARAYHPLIQSELTLERLERMVGEVPGEFIGPLVLEPTPQNLYRRKQAYIAFLAKRLRQF